MKKKNKIIIIVVIFIAIFIVFILKPIFHNFSNKIVVNLREYPIIVDFLSSQESQNRNYFVLSLMKESVLEYWFDSWLKLFGFDGHPYPVVFTELYLIFESDKLKDAYLVSNEEWFVGAERTIVSMEGIVEYSHDKIGNISLSSVRKTESNLDIGLEINTLSFVEKVRADWIINYINDHF